MITLSLKIEMPEELLCDALQHIRDFDVAHFDDVKISMWIDGPAHLSKDKILAIIAKIKPPFPETVVLESTRYPQIGDTRIYNGRKQKFHDPGIWFDV